MPTSSSTQQYRLPDLLREWPWTRNLSPHYAEAKKASSSWVASFHPFKTRGQKAFDACDLNLLASLAYSSRSDKDFIRAGCDLMNFYFLYDEYTDIADPTVADDLANIVMENMPRDPYSDELSDTADKSELCPSKHILGVVKRQFWRRASRLAKPGSPCFDHFISSSELYLRSVKTEAEDRAAHRIRTFDEYLVLRRDTCGGRPTLALIEFGLDLPEEVMSHPIVASLTDDAVDLIILVNDMHSYISEFTSGLGNHNILTPIMRDNNLDLQGGLNWLGVYTDGVIKRFLENMERVPSWGPEIDAHLKQYIDGMGQWVRGNDDWSCEGKRYYGENGLKVRDTRLIAVSLMNKGHFLQADGVESEVDGGVETQSNNLTALTIECRA